MNKEDNKEMEELSLKCFGKKYEWRKLTRKGLVIGHDKSFPAAVRRTPLTTEQAKQYMVKALEMRAKVKEENEAG